MKEIKFRAWGKDGDKGPKMWDWNHIRGAFECWLLDERAVVMHSTGAFDNKGNEIYEGDILQWQNTQYGADRCCYTVVDMDEWWYGEDSLMAKEKEVLGNIYDNPDMLKRLTA